MVAPAAVPNIEADILVHALERRDQLAQHPACQRGDDTDPDSAFLDAPRRARMMEGSLDLAQRWRDLAEKARPGVGQAHTRWCAFEQGNADLVLEIAHSTADAGRARAKRLCRPGEAHLFGGS